MWVNSVSDSIDNLAKIGHHIPLKYRAFMKTVRNDQVDQKNIPEFENLERPISLIPFGNLWGENLFGIRAIHECESCGNDIDYDHKIPETNLLEHNNVATILEHFN